ncbi:MAG TPA: hypothetical protein IAA29_20600 [Candidatus Paenibacillus intestinavium]|nr:hypothetical protein [Candidatus Paenibacillus intestinavium]
MNAVNDGSSKHIWNEVASLEKELDDIVHESTELYSNNIVKNQEIINQINSNKPDTIVKGLLSLALNADDKDFVQDLMVQYSLHKNENIRGIAILKFSYKRHQAD